jgi:hypothetical protein
MARVISFTLLGLTLLCASVGCAAKQVGPTSPSGYFFSLSASPMSISSASSFATTDDVPGSERRHSAELFVRVQNAQGHPVAGVPVNFQVESSWARVAEVVPSRVLTQNGQAQALFRSGLIGIVPIIARVEDTTQQITIAVSAPGGGVSAGGGGGGSGP